jgi:hypothetical protein
MMTGDPHFVELVQTPDGNMVLSFLLGNRCYEVTLDESDVTYLALPPRDMQIILDASCDPFILERIRWVLHNQEESRVRALVLFLTRELRDTRRLRGDLAFRDYEYHGHGCSSSLKPPSREWYDTHRAFVLAWRQVMAYLDNEPAFGKEHNGSVASYFVK